MYIPIEALNSISDVYKKDSDGYKAIYNVIDSMNPFGYDDIVFSKRQEDIADNVIIALKELEKWKKRKRL